MPWRTAFPSAIPTVTVDEVSTGIGQLQVVCEELQWWQLVPRPGEQNAMVWYDRATGEPTMVRESIRPATAERDGTVRFDVDEWTRDPGTTTVSRQRIVMVAELAPEGARWREVTLDGNTTKKGEAAFEASWAGGGSVRVVDDGRYESIGARRFRTTGASGIGRGVVRVGVGHRVFLCLRAFDLPVSEQPEEIGQPLIDLETGRTVAYWQYRPTEWDEDADAWLAQHPGMEVVVDDRTYQRRNCSGRDEIMLTAAALESEPGFNLHRALPDRH